MDLLGYDYQIIFLDEDLGFEAIYQQLSLSKYLTAECKYEVQAKNPEGDVLASNQIMFPKAPEWIDAPSKLNKGFRFRHSMDLEFTSVNFSGSNCSSLDKAVRIQVIKTQINALEEEVTPIEGSQISEYFFEKNNPENNPTTPYLFKQIEWIIFASEAFPSIGDLTGNFSVSGSMKVEVFNKEELIYKAEITPIASIPEGRITFPSIQNRPEKIKLVNQAQSFAKVYKFNKQNYEYEEYSEYTINLRLNADIELPLNNISDSNIYITNNTKYIILPLELNCENSECSSLFTPLDNLEISRLALSSELMNILDQILITDNFKNTRNYYFSPVHNIVSQENEKTLLENTHFIDLKVIGFDKAISGSGNFDIKLEISEEIEPISFNKLSDTKLLKEITLPPKGLKKLEPYKAIVRNNLNKELSFSHFKVREKSRSGKVFYFKSLETIAAATDTQPEKEISPSSQYKLIIQTTGQNMSQQMRIKWFDGPDKYINLVEGENKIEFNNWKDQEIAEELGSLSISISPSQALTSSSDNNIKAEILKIELFSKNSSQNGGESSYASLKSYRIDMPISELKLKTEAVMLSSICQPGNKDVNGICEECNVANLEWQAKANRKFCDLCNKEYVGSTGIICEFCPKALECSLGQLPQACPAGYYCPAPPTTAATPYPTLNADRISTKIPCLAGSYCLAEATASDDPEKVGICPTAYICPQATPASLAEDNTTILIDDSYKCPAGYSCLAGASSVEDSEKVKLCESGYICIEGTPENYKDNENSKCPAGYYSFEGAGSLEDNEKVKVCPAGFYCPLGTNSSSFNDDSLKCIAGKYCLEGATALDDSNKVFDCPEGYFCPLGTPANIDSTNDELIIESKFQCSPGQTSSVGSTSNSDCRDKQCTCNNGNAAVGTSCDIDGEEQCTFCNDNYFLDENNCLQITICSDAEYETSAPVKNTDGYITNRECATKQCLCNNGTAAVAEQCSLNNTEQCIECDETFKLNNGLCESCGLGVLTCNYSTGDIISCNENYYLEANECKELKTCASSEYESLAPASNGTTFIADRQCSTKNCTCENGVAAVGQQCPNNQEAFCLSCEAGFTLENNACLLCPADSYKSSSNESDTCISCGEGVKSCNPLTGDIISCNENYYLEANECKELTICANSEYESLAPASNGTTFTANRQCSTKNCTCQNGTASVGLDCPNNEDAFCISCEAGFILENNTCSSCPQGSYRTNDPLMQACSSCGENVIDCDASTGTITSCMSSYFLDENSCKELKTCASSEYESLAPTSNGTTFTADRQCSTKTCACENGSGASGDECSNHGDNLCKSCNTGFWLNGITCESCTAGSASCDKNGKTLSCKSGFVLENDACSSCPQGSYRTNDPLMQACSSCGENVIACDPSTGTIISCNENYYLEEVANECKELKTCASSEYESLAPTSNGTTFTADRQCSTKNCTCENGSGASGDECSNHGNHLCKSCNSGFWLNGTTCESCGDYTLSCDNNGNPLSCEDGFFIYNGSCTAKSNCATDYLNISKFDDGKAVSVTSVGGAWHKDKNLSLHLRKTGLLSSSSPSIFEVNNKVKEIEDSGKKIVLKPSEGDVVLTLDRRYPAQSYTENLIFWVDVDNVHNYFKTFGPLEVCIEKHCSPGFGYQEGSEANEATCNECTNGTYSTGGKSICTEADNGFYVESSGASEQKPCPPGTYRTNDPLMQACSSCGENVIDCDASTGTIISCNENYYLKEVANECKELKTCASSEYESLAPTSNGTTFTADRQCSTKTCTCENGSGASGDECSNHADNLCKSCNTGFWLNGTTCKSCGLGALTCNPSTGEATSCNEYYNLEGNECNLKIQCVEHTLYMFPYPRNFLAVSVSRYSTTTLTEAFRKLNLVSPSAGPSHLYSTIVELEKSGKKVFLNDYRTKLRYEDDFDNYWIYFYLDTDINAESKFIIENNSDVEICIKDD